MLWGPPCLPHPSAVKDICGELLSSTDKAAVMSEAQSPWGRWLMRIIGGTPTATPQLPAYPHTLSPTGPLHFTSSYSPCGLPLWNHQHSNWLHGFASRQVNWRGAEKKNKTTTTIWRRGPAEYESWREWKRSRAPPVTFLTSSRASQQANSHCLLFQSRKPKACQKHFN